MILKFFIISVLSFGYWSCSNDPSQENALTQSDQIMAEICEAAEAYLSTLQLGESESLKGGTEGSVGNADIICMEAREGTYELGNGESCSGYVVNLDPLPPASDWIVGVGSVLTIEEDRWVVTSVSPENETRSTRVTLRRIVE